MIALASSCWPMSGGYRQSVFERFLGLALTAKQFTQLIVFSADRLNSYCLLLKARILSFPTFIKCLTYLLCYVSMYKACDICSAYQHGTIYC
jgi:hypothetical protein